MRIANKSRPHKHHGLALVEITIVLPFFLFLTFISIEMGRYLYTYNTLTKMVRDASRYYSNNAYNSGDLTSIDKSPDRQDLVRNFLTSGNESDSINRRLPKTIPDLIVTFDYDDPYITISAKYEFETIFGTTLGKLSYGNNLSLDGNMYASLTMRAIN